jgi:hypothetical protein
MEIIKLEQFVENILKCKPPIQIKTLIKTFSYYSKNSNECKGSVYFLGYKDYLC